MVDERMTYRQWILYLVLIVIGLIMGTYSPNITVSLVMGLGLTLAYIIGLKIIR